jgi:hypothetical protein
MQSQSHQYLQQEKNRNHQPYQQQQQQSLSPFFQSQQQQQETHRPSMKDLWVDPADASKVPQQQQHQVHPAFFSFLTS